MSSVPLRPGLGAARNLLDDPLVRLTSSTPTEHRLCNRGAGLDKIVFSLGVIPVAVHASEVGCTPNFSNKARIEVSASASGSSEESRSSYGVPSNTPFSGLKPELETQAREAGAR